MAVKVEIRKRRQNSYPSDTILAGVGVCLWGDETAFVQWMCYLGVAISLTKLTIRKYYGTQKIRTLLIPLAIL